MGEQRAYGSTSLNLSEIGYGAMSIATDPALHDGVAPSLLHALEHGVTWIDTARVYPHSEEIIAKTLREWRGPRPIISTKLAPSSMATFRFHRPMKEAYTASSMRASVEASLKALGVETLDIVHLHQWHYLWMHEPEWRETLRELQHEGKIRCVAISAQDHEHDAVLEAVNTKFIDGVQTIVNLFETRPASALLPLAKIRNIGVIARCIFDSGGLSGTLSADDFLARPFLKNAPYKEYAARLEALRTEFVPAHAGSLSELALRFVLSMSGISAATIGMQSIAFVENAIAAADKGPLDNETVEAVRRKHVWTKNFYEKLL